MSAACFVVGAGPGMGAAIADRFAREGFSAGLLARTPRSVEAAALSLRMLGVRTATASADVTDAAALTAALEQLAGELGSPAVLVYNAYGVTMGDAQALTADELVGDLRANVVGALVAAQFAARAMRVAGSGSILLTGGGAALAGSTLWPSLGIGKAALRHLTWDLAEALEPAGVHVATVTICGAVSPGTHFAPSLIAEEYWRLHAQPRAQWEREMAYR